MINLLTALLLWLLTHGPTVTALALAFLIGMIAGEYLQFSNDDKGKDAHRTAIR